MDYGIISLLPVVVTCTVAILTKRVMEPVLLGTFVGFIILFKGSFLQGWLDALYVTVTDPAIQFILIIPVLFGIFTVLIQKSGSAKTFTSFAKKYVKSGKSSLIVSWLLGLIIFIDDYLNTLIVGPAMRNLTDENKVPREALGYVLKGTSSPLAVLTPFSTWAAFLAGLLITNGVVAENTDPVSAYLGAIPFVIYGMVALVLVPLVIFGVVPKFKGMKKAYAEVEETGRTYDTDVANHDDDEEVETGARLVDFFLPIITIVGTKIILGIPLEISIMLGIAMCGLLYIPRKIMKPGNFFDSFVEGMTSMAFLIILMIFAFILVNANTQLGLDQYVIEKTLPLLNENLFPAIVFIVTGALGFFTGNFFGTAAIIMPIIIPLAEELSVNPLLAAGAIISGIVFSSHACFYGDSLVLASTVTEVKPMKLAMVVLPYALLSAVITAIGYLIIGFVG